MNAKLTRGRHKSRLDVLVMDPMADGHHAEYVARILEMCLESGCATGFVASGDLSANSRIRALKQQYPILLREFHVSPPRRIARLPGSTVTSNIAWWLALRRWHSMISRQFELGIVVFPYLDFVLYAVALLGSPAKRDAWAGIAMRVDFHHCCIDENRHENLSTRFKRRAFERILGNSHLRRLIVIDELLSQHVKARRPSLSERIEYAPDPATLPTAKINRCTARSSIGLQEDDLAVLLYGAVSLRKGLKTFLDALIMPSLSAKVVGIVAGVPDRAAEEVLNEYEPRIGAMGRRLLRFDEFVESSLESLLFTATDCVWLDYENHRGMSGVLVLAGVYGRPVIATERGLIGHLVRANQLGLCVKECDAEAASVAIRTLTENLTLRASLGAQGVQFFATHTESEFKSRLKSAILPPSSA